MPATFLFGQAISFLAPINTTVPEWYGNCTICLASADFNGDGKTDVAYLGGSGIGTVLLGVFSGNGDGTFRPSASFPLTVGNIANLFAADFNHDGHVDFLVSGSSTYLYVGNGDGTFKPASTVPGCPQAPQFLVSAVADFNGDRNPDLVCGTNILLGNGDGTFHAGVTVDPGASNSVILVADFNQDGVPDLVMQQPSGSLVITLGHGDGTFGNDIAYPINGAIYGINDSLYGTVAADFNGDGKIDLVSYFFPTTNGAIVFTPGNGDGTLGAPIVTTTSAGFRSAAVADFNSDGKPDLFTLNGGAVLPGRGDGTFLPPVFFGYGSAVTSGDFNGDGLPDLVESIVGSPPQLAVLVNDSPGDGFLTSGVSSATLSWEMGSGSIASAFGSNLAATTEIASSYPKQTTLGGIRVHVGIPPNDTLAPLIYVSPTQINYLLPGFGTGFEEISIEHVGTPFVPKGIGVSTTLGVVSFYTVDSGLAAGYAVRVASDGTQAPVPVVSCTSAATCVAVPIRVSGDPVYLSLFGTGFDIPGGGLVCTTGNQNIPVSYAGPQQQIPGLDQVNLMLPQSLAGAGEISISCHVLPLVANGSIFYPGQPSNPAAIVIQ